MCGREDPNTRVWMEAVKWSSLENQQSHRSILSILTELEVGTCSPRITIILSHPFVFISLPILCALLRYLFIPGREVGLGSFEWFKVYEIFDGIYFTILGCFLAVWVMLRQCQHLPNRMGHTDLEVKAKRGSA
ncbi:hypothetical protein B0J17DRAFT_638279 [Rhizoctonia solani]|nr:hypothetical protein B0J17DRAFT_638279 [Rhizoctonia solani]